VRISFYRLIILKQDEVKAVARTTEPVAERVLKRGVFVSGYSGTSTMWVITPTSIRSFAQDATTMTTATFPYTLTFADFFDG